MSTSGSVSRQKRLWAALAIGVVMLVGGALKFGHFPGSHPRDQVRMIAVFPLENQAGGSGQEDFTDGMTEQIISALSEVPSLRVISSASVMPYKATKPSPVQAARELNVESILTGSIVSSGTRLRLSLQLVNGQDGKQLWAETYEREPGQEPALPQEVARKVAVTLGMNPAPARNRSASAEAFHGYLKGRAMAAHREEALTRQAITRLLEPAARQDPGYAPTFAALSLAYQNLASTYAPPKEVFPKAKEAALEAVRLDDSLSDAHLALAGVLMNFDWDWSGAEKEMQRAIALNPSSADAHFLYGTYLGILQRTDPAAAEYERARVLDPLSITYSLSLADLLISARQYDRAIAECMKLIEKAPDFAWGYAWLGMAKAQKREFADAITALKKANELDTSYTMRHFLATVQAAAGNTAEARKLLAGLEEEAKHRYVCAYEIATVYSNLGDNDKAYEWMQRGVKDRADCMLRLKSEPWMDSLRSDPRYAALTRQVGFSQSPR